MTTTIKLYLGSLLHLLLGLPGWQTCPLLVIRVLLGPIISLYDLASARNFTQVCLSVSLSINQVPLLPGLLYVNHWIFVHLLRI